MRRTRPGCADRDSDAAARGCTAAASARWCAGHRRGPRRTARSGIRRGAPVEALDVGVVKRFAGADEVERDPAGPRPAEEAAARELGTVIADQARREAPRARRAGDQFSEASKSEAKQPGILAALASIGAYDSPTAVPVEPRAASVPTVWMDKQREHIYGNRAYVNRVKQGTPTSAFYDLPSALRYTKEAWNRGTPVRGNPNVRELEFGHPVGIGPRGEGTQSRVRVHRGRKGIHEHLAGPVRR